MIGPVFTREVTIAPRRERTYIARSAYAGFLLLLISTAWLVMTGTQLIRDPGDFARFGSTLFLLLAPLQMTLGLFFSAMLSAGAVAQEKDRKTLILLLLTHLSNSELVLGKLLSSLLMVLTLLSVSIPIFLLTALFGGVSGAQIFRVFLVTGLSMLACGSLGSLIALWRDKTFQALALTVLILVLWVGFWESVGTGLLGESWGGIAAGRLATTLSPWSAVLTATQPTVAQQQSLWADMLGNTGPFAVFCFSMTVLMNAVSIVMVRVWNPSREVRKGAHEEDTWRKEPPSAVEAIQKTTGALDRGDLPPAAPPETVAGAATATQPEALPEPVSEAKPIADDASLSVHAARKKTRPVWDNPILWREICTRAYGRKTIILRLTYLVVFLFSAFSLYSLLAPGTLVSPAALAGPLIPLLFLSLVLVNAQAVTSLTSERDGRTFDLLLATDLSPREFVFGKLGGIFYNTKEMIALPALLCLYLWWEEALGGLSLTYLLLGFVILLIFVATVGVHIGMQYVNTRSAVAVSLGIIFFLFMGIATCMWIMVAFSGSFEAQLQPFLAFMLGGGVGLYVTLGLRNPSTAIGVAAFVCPLATFYAITSLLLGQPSLVFVSVVGAFGFTTLAMLIPAIDEFDVATGRTTAD